MGRVFHEDAVKKGAEQGMGHFELIKLVSLRARQKQLAVQGVKYLSEEQQAWAKDQSKFPIQALEELINDQLNLPEFLETLITPVVEDETKPKPVADKPKE